MKKIVLVFCMIACMFSFAACGGTEAPAGLTDNNAQQIQTQVQTLVEQIATLDAASLQQYQEYYSPTGTSPDAALYAGLQSWSSAMSDTGAYKSIESAVVTLKDGTYSVELIGAFENRNVEIDANVSKTGDALNSLSFNPIYSMGEKLGQAGLNTLMGVGTVFIILILMTFCISCFKYIPALEKKFSKKPEAEVVNISKPEAVSIPAAEETEEDVTDDLELAAVITAAIAASENTSTDGLIVRSIRRVNTNKWKRA